MLHLKTPPDAFLTSLEVREKRELIWNWFSFRADPILGAGRSKSELEKSVEVDLYWCNVSLVI